MTSRKSLPLEFSAKKTNTTFMASKHNLETHFGVMLFEAIKIVFT